MYFPDGCFMLCLNVTHYKPEQVPVWRSCLLADPEAAHREGGDWSRHPQWLQGAQLLSPCCLDQRHVSNSLTECEGRPGCDRVCVPEETHQGHLQPGYPGTPKHFPIQTSVKEEIWTTHPFSYVCDWNHNDISSSCVSVFIHSGSKDERMCCSIM